MLLTENYNSLLLTSLNGVSKAVKKTENVLPLWNGVPAMMTVWRRGLNILKHSPPTISLL